MSNDLEGGPGSPGYQTVAAEVLAELLRQMGVGGRVEASPGEDPGSVTLDIRSDDTSALLIGRRGATLDAIEYLVNRIVWQRTGPGAPRVTVDVASYRVRRQRQLEDMARDMADRARETRSSVTLGEMSARDRRTIHLALRDAADVTTESQGDEPLRRVVIIPADRGRPGAPASGSD